MVSATFGAFLPANAASKAVSKNKIKMRSARKRILYSTKYQNQGVWLGTPEGWTDGEGVDQGTLSFVTAL
jgi:hypothetical protein